MGFIPILADVDSQIVTMRVGSRKAPGRGVLKRHNACSWAGGPKRHEGRGGGRSRRERGWANSIVLAGDEQQTIRDARYFDASWRAWYSWGVSSGSTGKLVAFWQQASGRERNRGSRDRSVEEQAEKRRARGWRFDNGRCAKPRPTMPDQYNRTRRRGWMGNLGASRAGVR